MTIGRHWMKIPQRILNIKYCDFHNSPIMATSDRFKDVFSPENKKRTVGILSQLDPQMLNFFDVKLGEKIAGVLIPLCYDTQQRPSILYNLRSENLSLNKGEISFPGGSMDESDNGQVLTTALRETEEELGISPQCIEVWATLPRLPTIRSSLCVIPVLGLITEPIDAKALNINKDEVQYAFTVPLDHLCDPNNWSTTSVTRNDRPYVMPAYKNLEEFVRVDNEKITIWGLTSIITHMCLSALVPDVYQRDIPVKPQKVKPKL